MKSMGNTSLFKMIDASTGAWGMMQAADPEADAVPPSELEDQLRIIDRRMNLQMRKMAMEDLASGRIKLLWNPRRLGRVPAAVNIWLRTGRNGRPEAMVNITNHARRDADKRLTEIEPRALASFLQWGSLQLRCLERWGRVQASPAVALEGAMAFSRMGASVVDRLYGVGLHPMRMDLVSYIFGRHYLVCILGRQYGSEVVEAISHKCAPNSTTKATLDQAASALGGPDETHSVEGLVRTLQSIEGVGALNVRQLLEYWMKSYGEAAVLGLEYLPALGGTAAACLTGGGVVNDFQSEKAMGKHGPALYNALHQVLA